MAQWLKSLDSERVIGLALCLRVLFLLLFPLCGFSPNSKSRVSLPDQRQVFFKKKVVEQRRLCESKITVLLKESDTLLPSA